MIKHSLINPEKVNRTLVESGKVAGVNSIGSIVYPFYNRTAQDHGMI
jgi:hypothetical protein